MLDGLIVELDRRIEYYWLLWLMMVKHCRILQWKKNQLFIFMSKLLTVSHLNSVLLYQTDSSFFMVMKRFVLGYFEVIRLMYNLGSQTIRMVGNIFCHRTVDVQGRILRNTVDTFSKYCNLSVFCTLYFIICRDTATHPFFSLISTPLID